MLIISRAGIVVALPFDKQIGNIGSKKYSGECHVENMQTTTELKKEKLVAKDNAQNDFLQDELIQELVQRKTSLESLACEDSNEKHSLLKSPPLEESNILRDCVEQTLKNYLTHLDGQPVTNIYEMVLSEVEAPLLKVVMRYTQHNQCKTAELLGLSRGTLRKKLQQYGLL